MKKNLLIIIACFATIIAQAQLTGNSLKILANANYIEIPDAAGNSLNTDMTLEAWVYYNCSNTASTGSIINKGYCNGGANWSYYFAVTNQTLVFQKFDNGGTTCGNTISAYYEGLTNAIPYNTWTHVAAVMTGNTVTLYVNGVAIPTTLTAGAAFTGIKNIPEPLKIGTYRQGGGAYVVPFLGNIDDVRIWHTARTASEIAANYNAELLGNEAGLYCYWKLNETGTGAGITAINSATATGATFNGATFGTSANLQFVNNTTSTNGPPVACPVLWLKADADVFTDAGTTNATTGQTVQQWNDQSGNAANATCANATYRPTYVTNIINGLPVMRFTNNYLETPNIDLSTTDKTELYVVYKSASPNTNWECIAEHGSDFNTYVGFNLYDNAQGTAYNGFYTGLSGGGFNSKNYPFHANDFKVVNSSYDKSQTSEEVDLRINGKRISIFQQNNAANSSGNFANYPLYIGNRGSNLSYPLSGDIAEIIMYNRKLTAAEKIVLDNYLTTKYNIQCDTISNVAPMAGSGNCLQMGNYGAFAQDDADIDFGANDFTVEFWTMKRALSSNYSNIGCINKWNTSATPGTNEWSIITSTNGTDNIPSFAIESGSISYTVNATTSLPINKWYHIVAVKENTNLKIYVNGILEGTTIIPANTTINNVASRNLLMGYYPNGYANNSNLDEVRIWNTALSQATIRDWMCKKETGLHPNHASLARYYKFDETSGTQFNNSASGCAKEAYGNGGLLVSSGAPIGDVSTHDYTANTATANMNFGTPTDNFTATMSAGTSAGVQVYGVNELPNNQNYPGLVGNNKYAGVFVVNGNTTAAYNAVYNYTNNTAVTTTIEPDLKLYKRTDNASTTWIAASSQTLNASANTITCTGQNTEYVLSAFPTPMPPSCYGTFNNVGDLLSSANPTTTYNLLDSTLDNFTYELWVKPTQPLGPGGTSGDRYVVWPEQVTAWGRSGYGIGIAVGTDGVRIYSHAANYLASGIGYTGAITQWTHIAFTLSPSHVATLYINGLVVSTVSGVSTSRATDAVMLTDYYGHYYGDVASFRLFKGVRTGSQIASDMNTDIPANEPGLMSKIDFNNLYNGNGQEIANLSSNYPNLYLNKITAGSAASPIFNCNGGNMPTLIVPSCAAKFNATNTTMVNMNNSLGAFPAQGTIEFWMNKASYAGNEFPLGTNNYTNNNTEGIWFQTYNGQLIAEMDGVGAVNGNGVYEYFGAMQPNTDYHIAVTWDTVTKIFKGYLNGKLSFAKPFTSANIPAAIPRFTLGAGYNGARFYNGTLDEVRYWTVARTQAEILANATNVDTLAPGLKLYYNFYDNLLNGNGQTVLNKATATGATYNGTTTNTVKFPCSLYPPSCGIKFSGASGEGIQVPHSAALNSTTNVTYEAWIKTNNASNYRRIMGKGDAPSIYVNNGVGNILSQTIINGTLYNLPSNAIVADNEWHHVAYTYDGAIINIYIDGVLDNSLAIAGTINTNTNTLDIGYYASLNIYPFIGNIDEVSVWNITRSQADITASMNASLAGTEAGMVAYYNFNTNNRSGQNRIVENVCIATDSVLDGLTFGTALLPFFECAPPPFTNPECNFVGNGTTDYVTIPHTAALSLSDFTVAAYVKTTSTGTFKSILAKPAPGGQANYVLYKNANNKAQITFTPNPYFGGGVNIAGTTNINDGLWHYIVATRNSTSMKIFVDGVLEGTNTNSFLPQVSTMPLEIGVNASSYPWQGSLDEVSVWNSALSQAQITSLIGQQLVGNENNLVAYYNFDGINRDGQNINVNNLCSATGAAINGTSVGTFTTPIFTCSEVLVTDRNCNLLLNGITDGVSATNGTNVATYPSITQNWTMELVAKPLIQKDPSSNGLIPLIPPGHYLQNGQVGQKWAIYPDYASAIAGNHAGVGISFGSNSIGIYEHAASYMPSRISINDNVFNDWTHITVVCENGALKLYINGSLKGTAPASGYILHPSSALGNFGGYVNEVRVWNTVLSDVQIRNNINATLTGAETNLVSLYKFNNTTNGDAQIVTGLGSMANNIIYKTKGTACTPIFTCANTSTVTKDTLPGSGKMLAFGGTGSFAELGNWGAVPQNGSIMFWWNTSTLKNNAVAFSSTHFRKQGGNHQGINVFIKGNNLVATVGTDTTASGYQDTIIVAANITTNKWHHCALVWQRDFNEMKVYTNGMLTNTLTTNRLPANFESVKMGSGIDDGAAYAWNGYLDELSEWNIALSEAEIREQMCSKLNISQTNYNNALHYYRFDNATCGANSIHDYVGTAHGMYYLWYINTATMYWNTAPYVTYVNWIHSNADIPTSSAPIGSYSTYDYSGSTSQQSLVIDNEDSVHAQINAGTADGIHVYGENMWPNTFNGLYDTVAGSNHYAGVFVVNPDTAAKYMLDYNYTANANVTPAIESYLHLYNRNHNADYPWASIAGITLDTTTNQFTASGQHTEYILGKTATPLAIANLHLTGETIGEKNILEWTNSDEKNIAHYEIQRAATVAQLLTISKTTATGNNSNSSAYNYTDATPLPGDNYYRIKMLDNNGVASWSEIILLHINADKTSIVIYPNPTESVLNFNIGGKLDNSQITIRIFDATGKLVKEISEVKNKNTFSMNLQELASGVYNAQIHNRNNKTVMSFRKN